MKSANLTSTLLTRKGQASPTPVGPSRMAVPLPAMPPSANLPLLRIKDVPPAQPNDAHHENAEIDRFTSTARASVDRRIHMSLRLDPGRHLRIRLESSRTGRSMQSLLLQALDEFLERDGPGNSDSETARHNGGPDIGSRRKPSQTIGVEAGGGSTRSQ
jgi:hypothetical protein